MARMDVDYEHDDFDVGKKPRVIVKKKSGWLGKIVALLLGVVIGIIAGAGGLVGAGYYIATQIKIKDAVNTVNGLTGMQIPLSDYLSDEYAEMTLLGVFDGTAQTLTKISEGKGTLGDLDDISPLVGDFVQQEGGLIDLLAFYGIEATVDELMDKYLVKKEQTEEFDDRYLSDFLVLKINEIPFAKLIQTMGFEGSKMITILCYGIEGIDYELDGDEYVMLGDSQPLTLSGFMSSELDNRIEQLPLDAVMDVPQDEIMFTLFYGAEHRYTKTEDGVEMNPLFYTFDGEYFYDDNGEKLALASATEDSENTYRLTFKDGTEQIVTKQGDKYYAWTTDGKAILFPKTTIGDLEGEAEDLINGITLESALKLDDDSHAILKSIAYDENGEKRTIKDLREKNTDLIEGIALSEIVPADTQDAIVMHLLYGKENVHYSIDPETNAIIPLQKRVAIYDGKVFNEYGERMENATANGTESYTQDETTYDLVEDASLGTVQVKITQDGTTTKHDAKLYYVSLNGENLYYEPTTIGDMQDAEVLSNLTGRLQLKDVMDVGDHKLLRHLGEETIDNLPEAINTLTLDDVFGDHFYYRTSEGWVRITEKYELIDKDGNHIGNLLDKDGNYEGKLLDENGLPTETDITFLDIHGTSLNVFDSLKKVIDRDELDKALTGTWKYLLMDRNTQQVLILGKDSKYHAYTISGEIIHQGAYTYDGTDFFDDTNKKLEVANKETVSEIDNCYLLTFNDRTQQVLILGKDSKYHAYTISGELIQKGSYTYDDTDFFDDTNKKLEVTNKETVSEIDNCYLLTITTINHHHTITEMDGMMEYMSQNVQAATLCELKIDGIVKTLDDGTLGKEIVHIPNLDADIASKTTVGDLTVEQLTLYMSTMLDYISEMTQP